MTVQSQTSSKRYNGAGNTGPFSVDFYFLEDSHLLVLKIANGVQTTLVLNVDYTVTGAGDPDGGFVTTTDNVESGEVLVIKRDVPVTQETQYPANDRFPSASHEMALDKLTMIVQQQDARIDIGLSLEDGADISGEIPNTADPDARALHVIGFDEDGSPTLYDPASAVTADVNISVKLEASGSVATTQHARNESLPLRSDFSSDADHESAADAAGAQLLASQSKFVQSGTALTVPPYLKTVSDMLNGEPVSVLHWIDPAHWSAIRDRSSSHDCAEDISDAVSAMEYVGGGILTIPWGLYRLEQAIQGGSLVGLKGEGPGSVLRQHAANANVIECNGITDAFIEALQLYAAGSKSSFSNGQGVALLGGAARCRVLGCLIRNHLGHGIGITDSNDNMVIGNMLIDSPATDNLLHDEVGADISVQYASSRNIVRGNSCRSGNGTGIQIITVDSGDVADDNIIIGNLVSDMRMYGIIAYKLNAGADSVSNTIIANNNIRNISGAIEHRTNGFIFGAGIYIQGAEGSVVDGNIVQNTHSASVAFQQTLAPGGIGATNVTRVNITNNKVRTCGMEGITVRDPSDLGDSEGCAVVSGNEVSDVTRSGIEVKERGRVVVSDNTVDGAGREGVYVNNTTTKRPGISVTGNKIRNATRHGIDVNYCDTPIVSDNGVRTTGISGIVAQNCDDISVTDNSINDHTTRGIQIASSCARGFVDGNNVRGDGTSLEGIRLDALVRLGKNSATNNVTNWAGDFAVLRGAPNVTGVGNTGDGEDDLITHSMPANTLDASGKGVKITAWGTSANNANPKTVRLYFGSTALITRSLTVSQASHWRIEAEVIRTSSSANERYIAQIVQGGTTTFSSCMSGELTQDLTAAVTIKCTGEVTDAGSGINNNDIQQRGMIVEYLEN